MRNSRLSREVARLFDTAADLPSLPSRRTTRASLARFAYAANDASAAAGDDGGIKPEIAFTSDIEDAIKDTSAAKRSTPAAQTRKRKRTVTRAVTAPEEKIEEGEESEGQPTAISTITETETETTTETKPTRRVRKPARVTTATDTATGAATRVVQPPSEWEETYAAVRAMRAPGGAASGAAVDTMGCERLAGPEGDARQRRFHTLVALMLSSQTKDTVNAEAMRRLRTELPPHRPGAPPGLTLENILAVEPAVLNELIWKVGFHNNKTKYIKQAAQILRDQFNSDIPPTIEGLMSLPGVGPKMAYLCMSATNGWDRVEGIGVDVHVHRITNLWGWQAPPTRTPEETRLALQAWLPKDRWKEINWLLVGLGQTVCLPVGRRCGDCELGLRGLCKSAERKKVVEGRRRRAEVKVEERGVVVKKEEVIEEDEVVREVVVNERVLGEGELKGELKEELKAVKEEVKEET